MRLHDPARLASLVRAVVVARGEPSRTAALLDAWNYVTHPGIARNSQEHARCAVLARGYDAQLRRGGRHWRELSDGSRALCGVELRRSQLPDEGGVL